MIKKYFIFLLMCLLLLFAIALNSTNDVWLGYVKGASITMFVALIPYWVKIHNDA